MAFTSLGRVARQILEKAPGAHGALAPDGGPEKDMNDQIAVGSYTTKSFEMSDKAQKLYSDLPKDVPGGSAEAAAIQLDKIFDLFRDARATGHINPDSLKSAITSEKKVRSLAKEMDLEDEHNEILTDIMRDLYDYAADAPERIIDQKIMYILQMTHALRQTQKITIPIRQMTVTLIMSRISLLDAR